MDKAKNCLPNDGILREPRPTAPVVRTSQFDVERVRTEVGSEVLTKQSFADDTDINNIMRKYEKTGILPDLSQKQYDFMDVSSGFDYHECANRIHEVDGIFMALPAQIRSQFDNDAGQFLNFIADPLNKETMALMGLSEAKAVVIPPIEPPIVPPIVIPTVK